MPISGELEEHWKYYVPQPILEDMVAKVTGSVRELKILDPACGSGHFLVIAFDLLVSLYREEARHLGQSWSNKSIAEGILENNLHGVDIDPRAVQIAAAALFVKARSFAPDMRLKKINLVAPALRLARLPANDPALEKLRKDLRIEAGIPDELTNKIIHGLAGVDHLGTLLKVDQAIGDALRAYERPVSAIAATGDLFTRKFPAAQATLPIGEARATVLDKLEPFLARHAQETDLGLRLDGEQIAAGVRFIRMVKEGTFDLVVGNPPYQATTRVADAKYLVASYPLGRADLYATFLERGLELIREGGVSAMVTMRGWLFLAQFSALRAHLLSAYNLVKLSDLDSGAFEAVSAAQVVLSVAMSIFVKSAQCDTSLAFRPTPVGDRASTGMVHRKRAAILAQVGRFEFSTSKLEGIAGAPIVYWWSPGFVAHYSSAAKLGDVSPAKQGLATGDNTRFLRKPWEVPRLILSGEREPWVPYIKGAAGRVWIEPLEDVLRWALVGAEVRNFVVDGRSASRPQNVDLYFRRGVAFSMIGNDFVARAHRNKSICGHKGSSVFPDDLASAVCLLNSSLSRMVLESLNPGLGFEVGDVNRLPIFPIESSDRIYATLDRAFTEHEAAREASVEFKRPGPSPWTYAQDWAQRSVDRPAGDPLPPYTPTFDPPTPADFLSFAVGVALGRFSPSGAGLLDKAPPTALPAGILYISPSRRDSLDHPATKLLRACWAEQSRGDDEALRDWFL
jgi:hypothetical protein